MTAKTDVLVPALRDVRQAEAVVAARFRVHAPVIPEGQHRTIVEREREQARGHMRRLDERIKALQPRRGPAQSVLGSAWSLAGQVASMARIPLDAARALPAAVRPGRATRQQLHNTEEEYAAAAFALAACRAGERVARQADDPASSDLLRAILREDEQRLEDITRTLEQCADDVAVGAQEVTETERARRGRRVREP